MGFPNRFSRGVLAGASLLALSACGDGAKPFDLDFRGLAGGFSTADAARSAPVSSRPAPDGRGVISYPTYQVAVARGGETIADMAGRLGFGANELGRYNGIPASTSLRAGELIALPRMIGGAGGLPASGGTVDVASLAGGALDRAGATPATASSTPEPVRHQVGRGETAYSIARLYNVSVRSLAEWNSLGSDLAVREGQFLLIPPTVSGGATTTPATTEVAAAALPAAPAATVAPAAPAAAAAPSTAGRMLLPADGSVTNGWAKGKSDGIDIAASAGSPVRAAADGVVAAITRNTEQVPILVVRHAGNVLTVYAGIDNISVAKGDKVSRGQVIAKVRAGSPAFLHFQVREGTQSVDPMGYING